MAFTKKTKSADTTKSPDELFRNLTRRKIPAEMPHQQAILRTYAQDGLDKTDVAIELPTGSGKTLVGLLIAEWRRRKFNERVVYVCPTRQLVNQTHEQAVNSYGIDTVEFTGSARKYDPKKKTRYTQAQSVAITNYASLFNTNPYFDNAETIVFDDSHAAENYIASLWSLEVTALDDKYKAAFEAIANVIKPHIDQADYSKLQGSSAASSARWVNKLPAPALSKIADELIAVLDEHTEDNELAHSWSLIRDHLLACNLYYGRKQFLIRPMIPPTWDHSPFENAKQRIYMSATLGRGGDLERLLGRKHITRLRLAESDRIDRVGRRFFMFPGMSLDDEEVKELRSRLMDAAGRSVFLSPDDKTAQSVALQVKTNLSFPVYNAQDIEHGKRAFTSHENAVACLANRYDGIDFPNEECRLLCVHGLPKAMNLQERFFMSRMGAGVIFNERVQTRVIQATGRCTRALQDYSAVLVTGSELQDFLTDKDRRKYFNAELQAELAFGVQQSEECAIPDFVENFNIFRKNEDEWAEANQDILDDAEQLEQEELPAVNQLSDSVIHEIQYQRSLWQGDYESAYQHAITVLSHIKVPELKGYRALWHYLAGSAATLATDSGQAALTSLAQEQFRKAKKATGMLSWLVDLAKYSGQEAHESDTDNDLVSQVEALETFLRELGLSNHRKFVKLEKRILEGLEDGPSFEGAHEELGRLLGFSSENSDASGAPDPWWISSTTCIVFEDHANAGPEVMLGAGKARQAAGHVTWLKANVEACKNLDFCSILVTPARTADTGALPHLENVKVWRLEDFKAWAQSAVAEIRDLRSSLGDSGDLVWRSEAYRRLQLGNFSANRIKAHPDLVPGQSFFSL